MSIEITLLISIVSLAFALYSGFMNIKRNNKTETQAETSTLTTVIVELKYISKGITDIQHDMNNLKEDIQNLRDKNTIHSESIKSILDRVLVIEKKVEKYHSLPVERNDVLNE